ncbi:putative vesicle transport protein, Use1 [Helianthus annuus]|nr:putative vesicle transport protein, Use1 [Helianthus annuus]
MWIATAEVEVGGRGGGGAANGGSDVGWWRPLLNNIINPNLFYGSTLRELLEQLAAERTPEGLPSRQYQVLHSYIRLPVPALRPPSTVEDRSQNTDGATDSAAIKLDAAAQAHITKHRKLEEDLTDEMVGLARQLKESTLMMNQSIKNIEKILDSTEEAVERSLARGDCTNAWESNVGILVLLLGFFLWHLLL